MRLDREARIGPEDIASMLSPGIAKKLGSGKGHARWCEPNPHQSVGLCRLDVGAVPVSGGLYHCLHAEIIAKGMNLNKGLCFYGA